MVISFSLVFLHLCSLGNNAWMPYSRVLWFVDVLTGHLRLRSASCDISIRFIRTSKGSAALPHAPMAPATIAGRCSLRTTDGPYKRRPGAEVKLRSHSYRGTTACGTTNNRQDDLHLKRVDACSFDNVFVRCFIAPHILQFNFPMPEYAERGQGEQLGSD